MRRFNVRIISTFPPRKCGIGTFSRDLTQALENFTNDIRSVKIAAVDKDNLSYGRQVDMVIDQYDPDSWERTTTEIIERARRSRRRTVLLLQHEFGLDPADDGTDCRGHHYVDMARRFTQEGIMVLVYLHTVLLEPDDFQRDTMRRLAEDAHALVVTTDSAIDILKSDAYGIPIAKLQHIDHGIRTHTPSDSDRLAMKKLFGMEGVFLVTTLGLRSPDKGHQYSLRAYARFIKESLTEEQRRHVAYLIGGQYHPEFMKAVGGKLYRDFQKVVDETIAETGLRTCTGQKLRGVDFHDNDVVFLDTFLDESLLLQLYTATNVMLLPYLNMQQISSGILADTLGSARVAVATKFMYAQELLTPRNKVTEGLALDKRSRGILVDPGEPCVEQIAQALDYLVFNEKDRLQMEHRARMRGHEMRWDNTAWQIIHHIQLIQDEQTLVEGRGVKFVRTKPSVFEKRNAELLAPKKSKRKKRK